jgi:S1-C subfamily serine protease
VLQADPRTDLAVLKIDTKGASADGRIRRQRQAQVGDLVLAIGDPFGVGQTVTMGIVSALARTQVGISDYQFFIQTDAAINPGNSGGALVDDGRQAGRHQHGDLFALRRLAGHRLCHSRQSGAARGPAVAVDLQMDLMEKGVVVVSVAEGTISANQGFQPGDIVRSVNGTSIGSVSQLQAALNGAGGHWDMIVQRGEQKLTLSVSE